MLCSKCYKEISDNKVVEKSSIVPWQDRWGNYCKKCAIKLDKERRKYFTIFFSFWLTLFVGGISVAIWKRLNG